MPDALDAPTSTGSRSTDTAERPSTAARSSPPRAHAAWWWTGLRPIALRIHFYAGVFVGPFVLVAALTGLVSSLAPQLEQALFADALAVPIGTTRVDLDDQVVAAAARVPGRAVVEIRPGSSRDATTRVSFAAPDLPKGFAHTAFVDPYTGRVDAVLDTEGDELPLRALLEDLHRSLLLGSVGRVYSELAASWLGVITVSGLAIWVARRRGRARVRRTLLPTASTRGRVRLRSWHGALGLWAGIGMLALAVTGIADSQFAGANIGALRASLDWTAPAVATTLPAGTPTPAPTDPVAIGETAERVLVSARAAGLSDPVAIAPGSPGQAWTVTQVQRYWPEKQDAVAVDPATGRVVDTVRFGDWPLSAKLARWGIDLHAGRLFGIGNQIALAVLALVIIAMVVSGYRMWWLRLSARPGTMAPGGRLRPNRQTVVAVGMAAIALGVYAPLLGVSVVVFVLVDLAASKVRARRG